MNDYTKEQLEILKNAIKAQDAMLMGYQIAKLETNENLSELTALVRSGANAQALAFIDDLLNEQSDDGYLDYLVEQAEKYGIPSKYECLVDCECFDDESWVDRLIKWADENNISVYNFPQDREEIENLKELDLSDCGLESLPDEFANLQSHEKLYLWSNKFKEFPKAICKLKNLKELDLSDYGLETLPDEFANLQSLKKLNLSKNYFKEFPKALCGLKNLKELDLSDYGLETLPDEFANLQNLEKLDLKDNEFKEFPKAICKLKNLKELISCEYCFAEYNDYLWLESLPDEFANLQNLEKLNLSRNKFKEFPKAICKLTNLKELDLSGYVYSYKDIDYDDDYDEQLIDKHIDCCCLEEAPPDEFANLQNLEKLNLSGNNFYEYPKVIDKLNNLKELNLYGCDLELMTT